MPDRRYVAWVEAQQPTSSDRSGTYNPSPKRKGSPSHPPEEREINPFLSWEEDAREKLDIVEWMVANVTRRKRTVVI